MSCDPAPWLPLPVASESDDDDDAVNGDVGRVRLRWASSCSVSGGQLGMLKKPGWLFGPPTKTIFDASRGAARLPTTLFSGKKRPFKRGLVLAND